MARPLVHSPQSSTLPGGKCSGNVTAAGSIASKVTSEMLFTNPAGIAVSGSGSTDSQRPTSAFGQLVSIQRQFRLLHVLLLSRPTTAGPI